MRSQRFQREGTLGIAILFFQMSELFGHPDLGVEIAMGQLRANTRRHGSFPVLLPPLFNAIDCLGALLLRKLVKLPRRRRVEVEATFRVVLDDA